MISKDVIDETGEIIVVQESEKNPTQNPSKQTNKHNHIIHYKCSFTTNIF